MRSAQVAVLAVAAVLVLAYATPVHAHYSNVCQAGSADKFAEADSIFAGTVTARKPASGTESLRSLTTFDVHRVWKGKNSATLTIATLWGWPGYRSPTIGETYLIYAFDSNAEDTRYYTDFRCGLNLWYTGQNYINPDGSSLESILPNDLEVLGTGKPAGQPPTFGVFLVVLGAAAVFVVLARAFLLWRWRRRQGSKEEIVDEGRDQPDRALG